MTFGGPRFVAANTYTEEGKGTGGASAVTLPLTGAGSTVWIYSCQLTNVSNGPATIDLVESTSGNILCRATTTSGETFRQAVQIQSSGEPIQIQFDSTVTVGEAHFKVTYQEDPQ